MVVVRCPCSEGRDLWGELWWVGEGHQWVFFDDDKRNDTYAERVQHCPGCGRQLDRKNLKLMRPVF